MYASIKELLDDSKKRKLPISELMIEHEMLQTGLSREKIWNKMASNLDVMLAAMKKGTTGKGVFSKTGLSGGEAVKLKKYRENKKTLSGDTIMRGVEYAVATNEVNASMGLICAAPTAGSTGTIPGILSVITHRLSLSYEKQVRFLFSAGAIGLIIANNAGIAGATGGCQAEVGTSSAMGAGACVEIAGGSPNEIGEAVAMAISNLLGLVCDPVAGLVEVPCVKRNAIGASNGLIAADMALAGLTNKIPVDEVIAAMDRVGKNLPKTLRETGLGGIAATPTGIKLKMKIFGEDVNIEY